MNVLNCIKNMLCSKNAASELSHESRLYKTIVKTANHPMLILNKDKCIINVFNIDNQKETLPVSEILGKYLDDYKNDPLSPFYQACILFDEVFDKVLETGDAVKLSYKVKDSFLRAQVSRIEDDYVLIHIHDITDIVKESQLVEQNSYKELSMALTAGGLTSWRYDVKERILSSSHNNPVIGDRSTIENVLDRTPLEYKNDIVKMFDDIVSHQSVHRNIRVKIQTVAGDLQWTDIHAMPYLLAPNGDVLIIMGSQKNVTSEYEIQQIIDQLNKQSELILDNIHSGLVYIAPDYIVIWENVSKVFHHPSLVNYYKKGTHCYEAFNRSTPCDHCVMCEAMRTLKPAFYEFTNEAGVCVEAMANPLLDVNNKVEGVILRLDDVTQKKDTSKRLKETQRKVSVANKMLSAIVDNLPSSLLVKDVNDHYKYIMVNKEFCKVLGLSENDILGKTDYDLFSKEEADNYRIDDIKTVELNQTKITDGESIYLKNRVVIWYTIKTPIINAGGDNNKLLIVIGIDITENRKAYEELAVAKKKAEESDRLKSSFLANMSHEIRTPLNAIVGFSELMLSSNNDEEKAEYMRIISTNNDLLLRLINDILDLSKLESGVVKLQIMRFDLAEYFKELSATMKQMVLNPDVEFIAVNPYESCIVETDKMRLTQVWHNFMTNAIKYTMTGYIKMGYEFVNDGITIYVEDSGIGIASENRKKLFSRFQKLDSFAQGTGLGLSICKAITELAGGRVGYEPIEGNGSRFWSWVPIDAQMVVYKTTSSNTPSLNVEPDSFTVIDKESYLKNRSCKILVAEDNDSNFQLVNHMLKHDFQISRVENGLEAVQYVKKNHIDLILMDIKMPVMDGLQATREIRTFNSDIQIIALTANAFELDRDEALNSGCNDFITKPVSKADLMSAMFRICQSRSNHQ